MRKGGGREKGHAFENEVAKILMVWSGVEWKRIPQSGGWGSKDIASGDLFCVTEFNKKDPLIIPISLELKKVEAWEFVHFFKGLDSSPLGTWWTQSVNDASKSKKVPVLIFSRNRYPIFIMIGNSTLTRLEKLVGCKYNKKSSRIQCIIKRDYVSVILLSDFLSWITFEILLRL